jgi:hypothetical protein
VGFLSKRRLGLTFRVRAYFFPVESAAVDKATADLVVALGRGQESFRKGDDFD